MREQPSQDEFLRLFSQHSRRVSDFISTLVINPADADEVFQNTCVVLWNKFSSYDPDHGTFYAWACKIAYLEILTIRRKSRRMQTFSEEALDLLATEVQGRAEEISARQMALEHCLKKLKSEDRELIAQRYYHQRKPKEISKQRTGSVHVVYRALARIHLALRNCVSRSLARENI